MVRGGLRANEQYEKKDTGIKEEYSGQPLILSQIKSEGKSV